MSPVERTEPKDWAKIHQRQFDKLVELVCNVILTGYSGQLVNKNSSSFLIAEWIP